MFTTTQDFGPMLNARPFILTIKANGGSVKLSVEHAPGVYVTAQTYSADGAHQLFPGQAAFRLTPAGGAEFNLR